MAFAMFCCTRVKRRRFPVAGSQLQKLGTVNRQLILRRTVMTHAGEDRGPVAENGETENGRIYSSRPFLLRLQTIPVCSLELNPDFS